MGRIGRGVVAGAAGTVALQAVTYLDMLGRGRAPSSLPGEAAARLADRAGMDLRGEDEASANRREALGALAGFGAGIGVGVALSLVMPRLGRRRLVRPAIFAGAMAMAAADGPMVVEGLTDPRRWSAVDWAADVVPHLAYGLGTVAALRLLRRDPWRVPGEVIALADGHRPLVVQ
jgi:hypothetical protein